MSGLIHVPSADMNKEGEARIGGHFLNRELLPDEAFFFRGSKYHSTTHYLSITPFSWMELAYTCTLMKGYKNAENLEDYGFTTRTAISLLSYNPLKK